MGHATRLHQLGFGMCKCTVIESVERGGEEGVRDSICRRGLAVTCACLLVGWDNDVMEALYSVVSLSRWRPSATAQYVGKVVKKARWPANVLPWKRRGFFMRIRCEALAFHRLHASERLPA